MISPRDPQGSIAIHPLITYKDVLEGIVKGVSYVKHACNVGRGYYHGKGRPIGVVHWSKKSLFLPSSVPLLLNWPKVVCLWNGIFFSSTGHFEFSLHVKPYISHKGHMFLPHLDKSNK